VQETVEVVVQETVQVPVTVESTVEVPVTQIVQETVEVPVEVIVVQTSQPIIVTATLPPTPTQPPAEQTAQQGVTSNRQWRDEVGIEGYSQTFDNGFV